MQRVAILYLFYANIVNKVLILIIIPQYIAYYYASLRPQGYEDRSLLKLGKSHAQYKASLTPSQPHILEVKPVNLAMVKGECLAPLN